MAQEREIATRIRSLGELAEIVTAIRAIAASQMQQALRSSEAIGRYSGLIRTALSDAASLLPADETIAPTAGKSGQVLFGAEHGLCGGFNQQLLRAIQRHSQEKAEKPLLIVVGSRAARLCRERGLQPDVAVPMATHYAGVTGTAHRVAADLFRMLSERQVAGVELVYATHGGQVLKVQRQKLLPLDLPSEKPRSSQFPPIINVRPRQLLDGMISEYLFAVLENAAMQSFFSENFARFRTMEAAHQNIRKKSAELTTLAQRMRQEAVTSEILELISGAEALSSVRNASN
ncbi:MAG: F0F1 ATP synthase subunit gamma [Deltaproteobacteria bacterium]|nr:F0F1 ATP synthase subunit gamma [Deltaproteobacteria bacterium]